MVAMKCQFEKKNNDDDNDDIGKYNKVGHVICIGFKVF